MAKQSPARLTKVSINLPFGLGGAEWTPDAAEQRAAWSLYVELVTRVSIQPLNGDDGMLREALNSLHSLFGATRLILREAGPGVGSTRPSLGGIAIAVLNRGLRPFLTKWHPRLLEWEAERPASVGARQHEAAWSDAQLLRTELAQLQAQLERYADALAKIAGADH